MSYNNFFIFRVTVYCSVFCDVLLRRNYGQGRDVHVYVLVVMLLAI